MMAFRFISRCGGKDAQVDSERRDERVGNFLATSSVDTKILDTFLFSTSIRAIVISSLHLNRRLAVIHKLAVAMDSEGGDER
jgi:hypothetical protein